MRSCRISLFLLLLAGAVSFILVLSGCFTPEQWQQFNQRMAAKNQEKLQQEAEKQKRQEELDKKKDQRDVKKLVKQAHKLKKKQRQEEKKEEREIAKLEKKEEKQIEKVEKKEKKEEVKYATPEEAAWAEFMAVKKAIPFHSSYNKRKIKKWEDAYHVAGKEAEKFSKKYPNSEKVKDLQGFFMYYYGSVAKRYAEALAIVNTRLNADLEDKDRQGLLLTKVKYLKPLGRMREARKVIEEMKNIAEKPGVLFGTKSKASNGERFLNELAKGDRLPAFSGLDINGNKVTHRYLKGKVGIILFWYINAQSTPIELKETKKLLKKYGADRVAVIGISCEMSSAAYRTYNFYKKRKPEIKMRYTEEEVAEYCKKEGVTWPQIYDDVDPKVAFQFGFAGTDIPYTIVVDKRGKIVYIDKAKIRGDFIKKAVKKALGK